MLMVQLEHLCKEIPSLHQAKNVASIERGSPAAKFNGKKAHEGRGFGCKASKVCKDHMVPLPCKLKAPKNCSRQEVFVRKGNVLK